MLLDRDTRRLFTKIIVIPKQLMQYFVEPLEFKLKVSDGGVQSDCLKVFCRYIKMQIYKKKNVSLSKTLWARLYVGTHR